ncbi:WhiB family transcriptional regulator [Haloechinothrix sp. LS1_15]|uniref:WhiB family transcriptional regulator n=1 Tax=Haloechinothrix sp. LS1_15 TaxID=2652248 RepID=UPI00294881C1|nr:WhiB family transcriptional regulator [Haloechinothrix sp. LS1_15]MDV6013515.1 WhiB family transcriptional regulator [Haloechinothrix sp. LS1_15]
MERTATDWRLRAACRDSDPELFFPISEVGPDAERIEQAKAICGRCPVQEQCLEFALTEGLDHGIFGGTTATERRELVWRRRAHRSGVTGTRR